MRLVDTAGMRRWGAWDLSTPLEGAAVGLARRALQLANVVVLVVDASGGALAGLTTGDPDFNLVTASPQQPTVGRRRRGSTRPTPAVAAPATLLPVAAGTGYSLTRQDCAIAEQVLSEGRGLVVALNKVDTLAGATPVMEAVRAQLDAMQQASGVEIVAMSALTGTGVTALMPAVMRTFGRWNARVPTARLNAWLALIARHHPPPSLSRVIRLKGRSARATTTTVPLPVKLKYVSQVNARPPTFCIFANRRDGT